ncbi:flavin monoamine oxidase family protein [Legionella sp. 29fVS95]|uniref:flavin monoamine oxidase family protein n=1 Tax=Legionella sp. 29fVS95 TaxID=3402813 RepID=UPI003AF7EDAB
MFKRILIIIFLIFSQTLQAEKDRIAHYKVIIIGAGIAGLEAGHYLQKHGVNNYIILEARNRIGGRVSTIMPWKEVPIELGAGIIHGGDQSNPLMKLAKKWHLATASLDSHSSSFYNSKGKEISDAIDTSYEELYLDFEKLVEKKRRDNKRNAKLSVSDVVLELINQKHLNKKSQHGLLYEISDKIEQEYAADIHDLSALWYDNEDNFPGKEKLLLHGYKDLVNGLAKNIETHILLNQVVIKVNYQNSEAIVVSTNNNKKFIGEYVICTLPLGVLKTGRVKFIPQLPRNKIIAMEHLNMGIMNKIIMLFPKVFWDSEQFISYISPAYWSGTNWVNKGEWIEFDNLNYFFHQPILSAIVSADFAKNLEDKKDTEIIQSVMKTLKTIYGEKIPAPTSYVITRWGKDPYSEGSYSSLRPEALEDGKDYLNMARTVAGHLLFAGEATTNLYPATVYGAYLSGERAAKEIINKNANYAITSSGTVPGKS